MKTSTMLAIALWHLTIFLAGCPWRLAQPDNCNPQPGANVACVGGVPYICGQDLRWHPLQPRCSTLSSESVCCRHTSPRTNRLITACMSAAACGERGGVVELDTPDVIVPDTTR